MTGKSVDIPADGSRDTVVGDVNLIVVTGPTAGGKTAFAARLAQMFGGEIISADSRQVYRTMDIGTGKDYDDYIVHGESIPYHLIDIREPGYKYNVYEFQRDFVEAFNEIRGRSKMPVLAGGTGLYIQAVLEGYRLTSVPVNPALRRHLESKSLQELVMELRSLNENLHNTTDLVHRKRTIRAIEIATYCKANPGVGLVTPDIFPVVFGVKHERHVQKQMISERLSARLDAGMVDEVRKLLQHIPEKEVEYYGLEYKYITQYLLGRLTFEEMYKKLETAIHQFAKRQMTWFRKMERQGYHLHWIDAADSMPQKLERAKKVLLDHGLPAKSH
jgi:tRNA dimethylallyltransferase